MNQPIDFKSVEVIFLLLSLYESKQWARKLKKDQAKKTREIKKINSRINFLAKFHFYYFKNGQKSIFELPKVQFHDFFLFRAKKFNKNTHFMQ